MWVLKVADIKIFQMVTFSIVKQAEGSLHKILLASNAWSMPVRNQRAQFEISEKVNSLPRRTFALKNCWQATHV